MAFEKKPQIKEEELHLGCLACSTASLTLSMDRVLATGFGMVAVRRDGVCIWSDDDPEKTAQEFEDLAAGDPDHNWQIEFVGPMHGETYQRHGKENWVCIASNEGFA